MKMATVSGIDMIYKCASSYRVMVRRIAHSDFHAYCTALRTFEQMLGEDGDEEYWQLFLRRLKRYRFELSAAPVSFNDTCVVRPESLQEVESRLAHVEEIY